MVDFIDVFTHSSIRVRGEKILYFDPFHLQDENHDADLIFLTHDHFDHFSPDDIRRILQEHTVFVAPTPMESQIQAAFPGHKVIAVQPGQKLNPGIPTEVIPAYNPAKPFHPRDKEWVGYIVTANGKRIYVAGDSDATPEAAAVSCDIALLPIGGKYTMSAVEAAGLVNAIHPQIAIPTHYGSVAGNESDAALFAEHVDPSITVSIQKLY